MTRKKICVIVYANPDYYPPTVSAIYLLAEYYDLILVGRNFDPPTRQYPQNVSVHRLGNYSSEAQRSNLSPVAKLSEYLKFIGEAYKLLEQTSLIYAYEPNAFVASYLVKLCFGGKQAIIYQCHETPERIEKLTKLAGWVQRLEKSWINQASLVILPEKFRADFYQKLMEIDQSPMVVPNFPLINIFPSLDQLDLTVGQRWNQSILFYRGTISDAISMREILRSLLFLPEHILVKTEVQFVGFLNNLDANIIETELKTLNLITKYSFLGTLSYSAVNQVTMHMAIGFCLYKPCSKSTEGMATASNKIFEYAACYLPVILSDTDNFRSYFAGEEWVHFADPYDPQSIAQAIVEILADFDGYKCKCVAARRAFEQRFNYETAFAPVLDMVNSLLKEV